MQSSRGARATDYSVGDVIDGRFKILDVLGQGGFSKVYRVLDDVEGEERALKLFDNAAGYEAVRREIGALRKVRHPHVVEVYWAGKTNDGDWYLITEYIDGESLDDYATGKQHLRDREAVDVALDVLDALVAIHPNSERLGELDRKRRDDELSEAEYDEWRELQDKGLVHRDIKPLNVMLTRTGAKLLDFNIASRVGDPVRTQSGTPPYQAPDADLTQVGRVDRPLRGRSDAVRASLQRATPIPGSQANAGRGDHRSAVHPLGPGQQTRRVPSTSLRL